jgi:hypothetical protein
MGRVKPKPGRFSFDQLDIIPPDRPTQQANKI